MQEAISLDAPPARRRRRLKALGARVAASAPTRADVILAATTVLLLVLSFPDFDLWPLAWVALAPLMIALVRTRVRAATAFMLGWGAGAVFFYATCYWLTHAMIHFGGLPRPLAFALLVPGALGVGLFPALWALALARASARWGLVALLLAPPAWAACEWLRLGATGQLWNAIGYSQAYAPALIQPARWGGVYLVGFLIVTVNAALAYLVLRRSARAAALMTAALAGVALVIFLSERPSGSAGDGRLSAYVVAVQPNVSAGFARTSEEVARLVALHLSLSEEALRGAPEGVPRVVVWPESPMNFAYSRDAGLREVVGQFAREHRASVLFNSMEPAPLAGVYNSAVMVNEEDRLVARYDKIRLLPFGEYVPLPRWLPLTWLLGGIVGDFTPGAEYPLMPLGDARAGVFICFESAFPSIARHFAHDGADALVNISNDGYLGQTPVIRQHLANVVFRAVETGRPVLRVTNTGISAYITPRGEVLDATATYATAARAWTVGRAREGKTFYTEHGDVFVALCAAASLLVFAATFRRRRKRTEKV
ncbi:MAG TPA: apolipoprotein N-acyltransferase [Pyrinomonadaceae bacterium]|nr:apolipoprotein N-acyltransferase [Pyrinomonadaceae bacterium]